MTSLSIEQNIELTNKQIKTLQEQRLEIEKELLRLEGSLRVLTNFKQVGIDKIDVPKDIIENTEVVDVSDSPGTDEDNNEQDK